MRIQTITKNIYTFDELPDDIKEKAIEKLRDMNIYHDWYESTLEDYKTMFSLCGLDIENIYFALGYSQSDYCAFSGASWSYKKGWKKTLLSEFGSDHVKNEIVPIFEAMQKQASRVFFDLSFTYSNSGSYRRHYDLSIDDSYSSDTYVDIESNLKDLIYQLEQVVFVALVHEYEYLTSDEQIIEAIQSNEFEFDEFGNLA